MNKHIGTKAGSLFVACCAVLLWSSQSFAWDLVFYFAPTQDCSNTYQIRDFRVNFVEAVPGNYGSTAYNLYRGRQFNNGVDSTWDVWVFYNPRMKAATVVRPPNINKYCIGDDIICTDPVSAASWNGGYSGNNKWAYTLSHFYHGERQIRLGPHPCVP